MDLLRTAALRLFEYHAWATQTTLDSVAQLSEEELRRDMQTSHSSVWGTLEHVYQADAVWIQRFQGIGDAKLRDFFAPDLAGLRRQSAELHARYLSMLGGMHDGDWTRVLEYRFQSGQEARSPVFDTVLHVVNHGTYHRGQVVTMMRQLNAKPTPTDYIHYIRTHAEF